jgi:hypothetical protein
MRRIFAILVILVFCSSAYALDTGDLTVKGDVTFSKLTTNGFLKTTGGGGAVSVDINTYVAAEVDPFYVLWYNAGAPTLTSITIGANVLDTTEWALLDGQDQTVKTTSSPTFANPIVTGNLKFKTTVVATGYKEGVTTNVSTESNLTSAALAFGFIRRTQDSPTDIVVGIVAGVKGQMVTIQLIAKAAGNYVISKTGMIGSGPATGWSLLTFDTAGDSITLLYMDDTIGWIVTGNNGCTITQ